MENMLLKTVWTVGMCGVLTFAFPAPSQARAQQEAERQQGAEQNGRATAQLINELEALPVGRDLQFYRHALEQRGYRIIDSQTLPPTRHTQFSFEKNGQQLALTVAMNKKTDRSSQLEAAPLWWAKAQARTAARNRETDKTHEASSVQPVHPDAQVMSEQRMLQELRNLPTGKDQQFYRRLLTKRGYHIVQVNPEDNHVDFHVERNRQRMVLAVTFDPQSGESRKLAASPLWVERAETDPALDDQEDLQVALLVQELELLPLGRDKAFYRSALRNHGYHITRTVLDQQRVLEVEAVKNDQPVVLTVNFDEDSGRSTRVSASPLWWQEQESDQNRQLSQRD